MKARDIFGIIVRTVGLCVALYAVWNLAFGIVMVLGFRGNGLIFPYFTCGVPLLIVGIFLLRFGRQIVRFSYPEDKDDADA